MTARILPKLLAPIGALIVALAISSVALLASGKSPVDAFTQMLDYGTRPDSLVDMLNKATPYYLSAVAVAQPAPPPADPRASEAKQHYENGMAHFNLEEWEAAIEEWKAGTGRRR